jgi:tyrosine-protein kinase Etk/Wzc
VDRLSFAGAIPVIEEVRDRRTRYSRALFDRLGWLAVATAVGAALGATFALSEPRVYQAQALIQIGAQDTATRRVAQGAQPTPFDAGILRSRAVAAPVVDRLHLDIASEPARAPLLGALVSHFSTPGQVRGTWPLSLGYAWGGERLVFGKMTVPDALINVPLALTVEAGERYTLERDGQTLLSGRTGELASGHGVTLLVDRIDAQPGTRFSVMRRDAATTFDTVASQLQVDESTVANGSVRVSWRNTDPVVAAALVNGIANAYIGTQTDQRRDEASESLTFFVGQLPRVQDELERAEAALTRYRSRSGSMQPSADAQSFLAGSMDYQRQIAGLRVERMKALQRFTPEANEVKTIDQQIQELMRERRDMDSRMQNLSQSERQSVALTRDVKVAEDMYMTLRSKIEQLSLLQSDRSNQAKLIDAALPTVRPVGAGPLAGTFLGGLLGLAIAGTIVIARRRMRPVMADANEAETRLGMPMLGDIAFSEEQAELERQSMLKRDFSVSAAPVRPEGPQLTASANVAGAASTAAGAEIALTRHDDAAAGDPCEYGAIAHKVRHGLHDKFLLARRSPHAHAVEGLRNVRAALHFGLRNAPDSVVAITSPAPGAGKTFVAVNLAVLFAEAGQRVLLIDADMRRGKVASWFDQAADPGLADVLSGRVSLGGSVQPTVVAGLSILTAGTVPTNPSELLMSPTMGNVLRICKQRFDLVIIDTPPVLSVSDPMLVCSLAGSTVLVMRADATLPSQIDDTLKRLSRANVRLAGGTINGVAQRRSNRSNFATVNPYLGMPLPPAPLNVLKLEREVGTDARS